MKVRLMVIVCLLASTGFGLRAQEKPEEWSLNTCIEYALENNIQIQQTKISLEQSGVNIKQAQSQLWPSVSASIGQNFSNRPLLLNGSDQAVNTYSGNYGINASMTLFNGGKLMKNIQQQKLQGEVSQYGVLEAEKNIEMSILQIYMQILYAEEAVNVYQQVVQTSEYQRNRGEALLLAGNISKADFAQLEAQLSSDKYQLVNAENTLDYAILQLKQLLELGVDEDIKIVIPELDEGNVLKPLPRLQDVYYTSLEVMPQMKSSRVSVDIAGLETAIARSGYYPKISLTASVGTNHITDTQFTFVDQLQNNFNDGVGVTVSIPIFSNRDNKSAVEKAKLNEKSAKLDLLTTEKNLLQEVELAYQDAVAAQSQYIAANEKVSALKTSYELIEQQYNLGMKNTLELLTEKNNLLSAQQNLLQAKYVSIMNAQILNLYQDLPLEI